MKTKSETAVSTAENYNLSTSEFAQRNLVKPQTVRKQHSATGSYFGVRPVVLPNRKLLWPDNSIQQLIANKVSGLSQ
jgi:hypothetical protein